MPSACSSKLIGGLPSVRLIGVRSEFINICHERLMSSHWGTGKASESSSCVIDSRTSSFEVPLGRCTQILITEWRGTSKKKVVSVLCILEKVRSELIKAVNSSPQYVLPKQRGLSRIPKEIHAISRITKPGFRDGLRSSRHQSLWGWCSTQSIFDLKYELLPTLMGHPLLWT